MPNPYESMHVIKDATAQITEHIERLESVGLLAPGAAKVHKLMARQLGSAANQSAMLNLAQQEMETASKSERARLKLERTLAKPPRKRKIKP